MLVKTYSSTVEGIDARTITVEVNLSPGIRFLVVGLPDNAVKESQQRIIAAFANNKLHMPGFNILVNMAPADMRKVGSHYDLPIAIGILAASKQVADTWLGRYILVGELSLDGTILPVKGALPIAIQAWKEGYEGIILPAENATEAAVVQGIKVYGVENLMQVVGVLNGEKGVEPTTIDTRQEYFSKVDTFDIDFRDVKGQGEVKRALEIAAAGGHNILMIGPPGAGKSMLAKRMPTITPPMTLAEALETTKIHSVAGKLGVDDKQGGLLTSRPFRGPHHITSEVALVGGSVPPQPGEISLAHNGILFLDELPEFNRRALEVLRQPLDEKRITISRAKYSITYPANFMLIAAMNPCPCGYRTHPEKTCTCSPGMQSRYLAKISGPLMDRIDIQVEVIPVAIDSMTSRMREGETSAAIRERVIAARERQVRRLERDGYHAVTHCNAMLTPDQMERYCQLDDESIGMIQQAMATMGLSGRAYDRILKVARTIADLAGTENIGVDHVAEAIQYRSLDCNHMMNN